MNDRCEETCHTCAKKSNCDLIKNRPCIPEMTIDTLSVPEALRIMDGCRFWEATEGDQDE